MATAIDAYKPRHDAHYRTAAKRTVANCWSWPNCDI